MQALKSAPIVLLMALNMFAGAARAEYQDESYAASLDQAELISKKVANDLQPLLAKRIQVVRVERSENTPMATVVTKSGICVLILNTTPSAWAQWHHFMGRGKLSAEDTFEFAAAHEIAHCINKPGTLAQAVRNSAPGMEISGLNLPAGKQSETFADLFSLAYMRQQRDSDTMKRILHSVIHVRKGFGGFFFNTHATSKAIEKASEALLAFTIQPETKVNLVTFSLNLYQKAG